MSVTQDWLATVVMKQAAFHGLAEFYQSVVAQQTKSYGEEIARLQVSFVLDWNPRTQFASFDNQTMCHFFHHVLIK